LSQIFVKFLSQEIANIDSMLSSKSEPSLDLLTLKILEEKANNKEHYSVLSLSCEKFMIPNGAICSWNQF
jgi:hypothetical protein